ncbi:VOC family protein [Streptomyces sp. MP131-18]|uniref:VOC family protein n=1 Tax=Streptomyces sp. MP131-18 TaxID=1857892 RepID=UPI00097C1087|nr:VOC family protein [Streptomyces sp. MP131-18]ONK10731.1 27 kDa antigen Cfp30B [Streptomyces sp. MP131-18]
MTEAASPPVSGTHRWVSLMVHDLASSQEFYHELFGWEFEEGPSQLGPYVRAIRDGHPVAGLGEIAPGVRRVVAWLPYIATRNADSTAAMIRESGGTVAVGPLDVEGVGRLAIASDLSGAAFGLWEGGPRRRGSVHIPAGAPEWNELITAETTGLGKFYSLVFGYEAAPEPALPEGSDYLTLRLGNRPVASIRGVAGALPHDRGPHWLTYFAVPDVAEALERIDRLGGRQLSEPQVSPFGRWAQVADREGAPFAVIRAAKR